jgi:hypothetical protein
MIYDLAVSLGIKNHPVSRRACVMRRLNESSLCRALIAEAVSGGNMYAASTETIKLKRAFLRLPEVQEEFSIEKFIRLRAPSEFSMRLALESSELKHSMLRHTEAQIGTSLTKLSPVLSALAVMIFTHVTKVLEENSSSHPEVLLRNVINVGRSCPIIRDEILMQCVKQIRENPLEEAEFRIWAMMRACLKFFPPSDLFENYLETFLLSHIKSKPDVRTVLAASCIRHLHESVFLYGYNRKVTRPWDSTLKSVKYWLQPSLSSAGPSSVENTVVPISSQTLGLSLPAPPASAAAKAKNAPLYSMIDPAFVATPSVDTNTSPFSAGPGATIDGMKASAAAGVRGTRDNWVSRFQSLSLDEEDVSIAEFGERLFASSSKLDKFDRVVLLFWVCGYLPSKSSALTLLKELHSDPRLYFPLDSSEKARSQDRRRILREVGPPSKSVRVDTMESKVDTVKSFWSRAISRCVSSDRSALDTKAPKATRSSTIQSSPSHSSRKPGMLSHSVSDITAHDSIAAPADLPDVPIEESYITWFIYRDVILVGMEKIAAEYEQLQDRASAEVLTPSKQKFNFTPVSKDPSHSGQPPRARRFASQNNLPI